MSKTTDEITAVLTRIQADIYGPEVEHG